MDRENANFQRALESVQSLSKNVKLVPVQLPWGEKHELDDPVALLANLARALKKNGRVGVVDFKKDGWGPGPPLEERVDPELIVRDAAAAGLKLVRRETFLPYQFFLIFSR
jgi:hypothetical protein